jgi:hypothetical protein
MIPLEAEDWLHLEHAYGPATNVPGLLRQLAENPGPKSDYQAEPWFSLWSCLCHQDDVHTASYAAVPHIVRICLAIEEPVDSSFFQLPACIEIARAAGRGPALSAELSGAYRSALHQLHECAFRHASDDWDDGMALSVAAALAAAKGQVKVAEAIINLDDDIMRRIIAGDF